MLSVPGNIKAERCLGIPASRCSPRRQIALGYASTELRSRPSPRRAKPDSADKTRVQPGSDFDSRGYERVRLRHDRRRTRTTQICARLRASRPSLAVIPWSRLPGSRRTLFPIWSSRSSPQPSCVSAVDDSTVVADPDRFWPRNLPATETHPPQKLFSGRPEPAHEEHGAARQVPRRNHDLEAFTDVEDGWRSRGYHAGPSRLSVTASRRSLPRLVSR